MRNHLTHFEILRVLSVEMTKWSTILTSFVEIRTFHLKSNIFPSIYMTHNNISFSNKLMINFLLIIITYLSTWREIKYIAFK